MKRPEILAPAGNFDSLKAAIAAGCDAVYLGGNMFGARAYSNNFNNEEMIEAVLYAHKYGVKSQIEALEFRFSQFFLDDYLTEQDFQDIVRHEYSHLYANELHQENVNHDKRYKAVCKQLGIEHMGGYTCSREVGMAFSEAIHTYKIKKARG